MWKELGKKRVLLFRGCSTYLGFWRHPEATPTNPPTEGYDVRKEKTFATEIQEERSIYSTLRREEFWIKLLCKGGNWKELRLWFILYLGAWLVKSRVNLERVVQLLWMCHYPFHILRSSPSLKFCAHRSEKGPSYPLPFSDFMATCGLSSILLIMSNTWAGDRVGSSDQSFSASKIYLLRPLSSRLWTSQLGENSLKTQGHAWVIFENEGFIARNLGQHRKTHLHMAISHE